MRNEDRKHNYIESNKDRNVNLESYMMSRFNALSEYEEKYDKDLCEFNVNEIQEMYKSQYHRSLETLMTLNSQLNKYTKYCQSQNLLIDGQNHYDLLDKDMLNLCINTIAFKEGIISREELLKAISVLQNPSEKFVMLAYFEGFRSKAEEDLINLRIEDFDGNEVHLHSGRTITVSSKLKSLAVESSNTFDYEPYFSPESTREIAVRNFRKDDDRVVKDIGNSFSSSPLAQRKKIYSKMYRLRELMGLDAVSSKSLNESGRIEYIKKLMAENNYVNVKDCILVNRAAIDYIYGTISSVERWILKYGEFF